MTRNDLVKQLEKAEQWQAATRDHHISISFPASEAIFRAGVALHIWDTAYAAGAKDERERICNMGKDDRYSHQYVHSFLADILARGEK